MLYEDVPYVVRNTNVYRAYRLQTVLLLMRVIVRDSYSRKSGISNHSPCQMYLKLRPNEQILSHLLN